MLRLIKWLFFLTLVVTIVYGVSFFMSLDDASWRQTKRDAHGALDSGDAKVFTGPLSEKLKEDLQKKKTNFFAIAREKLKKLIGDDN